MEKSNWIDQFNFVAQCRRNNISLWQCPSFLFLIMGLVNICAMWATYYIGAEYAQVEIVLAVVAMVAIVILFFGYIVSFSFQKLLELNRSKNEFIDVVSHQLRTPLNAVKWSLSLVMEHGGNFSPDQAEYIVLAKENNERMVRLLNDLLIVSRLDQEKIVFQPEAISVSEIVREIITHFANYARANNVDLLLEPINGSDIVFTDRQYLKIVLDNLIDNAIRYIAHRGFVKIVISGDSKMVECKIIDNGVGIPKVEESHIYQKFFRSKNVMRYRTEGTGMGLYIVKNLIEKMHGNVSYISQENLGTTFTIRIPSYNKK